MKTNAQLIRSKASQANTLAEAQRLASIAEYEAQLEAEAEELDLEPLDFDEEEIEQSKEEKEELAKVTVRASGKCHRAIVHPVYGMMISCSCPGSRNGKLESVAVKIADGWEKANCGN